VAVQRRQPPEAARLRSCCCPGRPSRKRAHRERRTLELLVDSAFNHQVGPWFRDWMREAVALAGQAG
jgi:hypothetical protein